MPHRSPSIRNLLLYALAALGTIAAPQAAWAISCTATAGTLPFGQYNAVTKTQVNATVTISITCTGPGTLNYVVTLSPGQSGTAMSRYMQSGPNRLNYQVYKDSARTQVFADGNGGTTNYAGTYSLSNSATTLSASLYAAVLPGQAAVPGSYADTLTMVLTY